MVILGILMNVDHVILSKLNIFKSLRLIVYQVVEHTVLNVLMGTIGMNLIVQVNY